MAFVYDDLRTSRTSKNRSGLARTVLASECKLSEGIEFKNSFISFSNLFKLGALIILVALCLYIYFMCFLISLV